MRYRSLAQCSQSLAAWLQYPLAVAAILRSGMTVVNVNPRYTPREL